MKQGKSVNVEDEYEERRRELQKDSFADDLVDRLLPSDETWWEMKLKRGLEVKRKFWEGEPDVDDEEWEKKGYSFKAFGGSIPEESRRRRSSDFVPTPKRVPPGYDPPIHQKLKQEKKIEEDHLSFQMKEMSIDSPGIIERGNNSNNNNKVKRRTSELGRLVFLSSMDCSMSIDFNALAQLSSINSP